MTKSMGTLNYRRKREWNHIKLRHSFLIDGREDERTLLQYVRKRFDRGSKGILWPFVIIRK